MKSLRRLFLFFCILSCPSFAWAQQSPKRNSEGALQAFMLTTTYGVIAGSLTGLASLAFYENPGNKGRNIAIGASLGLYVGILLGAYIVYVPTLESSSPSQEEKSLDEDPIRLDSGSMKIDPVHTWTPWVNWRPDAGTQLGVVYNF